MSEQYWAELIANSVEAIRQGRQMGRELLLEALPWWMWALIVVGFVLKIIKKALR